MNLIRNTKSYIGDRLLGIIASMVVDLTEADPRPKDEGSYITKFADEGVKVTLTDYPDIGHMLCTILWKLCDLSDYVRVVVPDEGNTLIFPMKALRVIPLNNALGMGTKTPESWLHGADAGLRPILTALRVHPFTGVDIAVRHVPDFYEVRLTLTPTVKIYAMIPLERVTLIPKARLDIEHTIHIKGRDLGPFVPEVDSWSLFELAATHRQMCLHSPRYRTIEFFTMIGISKTDWRPHYYWHSGYMETLLADQHYMRERIMAVLGVDEETFFSAKASFIDKVARSHGYRKDYEHPMPDFSIHHRMTVNPVLNHVSTLVCW